MTEENNELIDQGQNDELVDFWEITIDKNQEPLRIDKFLTNRLQKATRNRIQNAIRSGAVLVNDRTVKPNFKIQGGNHIRVILPKSPGDGEHLIPEDIPLDIVHEDEEILIVNKKPGMVVHPGIGHHSGTLVNALAYHFKDLPVMPGNDHSRVGLVHRIDKDTSGLLVIAKTDFAMSHLAKQFFDHSIHRRYQALVWGEPDDHEGTIEGHIGRHPRNRLLRSVYPEGEEGKWARTHYTVLEPLYYVSLVECRLETGRTHQIRVHMKHKGHPLFGDKRYGGDRIHKGTVYSKYKAFVENCMKKIPRQALHAKSLGFVHPGTGKEVYFESELPEDMANALETWRNYVHAKRKQTGTLLDE
ncbi:MAG: RluA family pseudouridine synthase [Bacteroidota bacterium]